MKYIYLTDTSNNFIPTKTCHLLRMAEVFAETSEAVRLKVGCAI